MIKLEQFKNCISIDDETTGLDPNACSIISVGAISLSNILDEIYLENYLRSDSVIINDKALEVNGESREALLGRKGGQKYISEEELLRNIIEFADEHRSFVIIGKNPKFDYDFLKSIWVRGGKDERSFPFSYRVINYADLVTPLMLLDGYEIPEMGFSSSDIQKYLGIPDEPKPHNALTGARYNVMALIEIIKRYNYKFNASIQ